MLISLPKEYKQVFGGCEEEARPGENKTISHPPIIINLLQ